MTKKEQKLNEIERVYYNKLKKFCLKENISR